MATSKFTVERVRDNDLEVEASTYVLSDGYFWFRDYQGSDVFTIQASDVYKIERQANKK